MLKVAVGHSIDPDSEEAIAEVLEQCQVSLAGQTPRAGILFAAIDFEHQVLLDHVLQQFPDLELVGCTTDGELSSEMGFQQDSLSLILFCSDAVEIRAAVTRDLSQTSVEQLQQLGPSLQQQMEHPSRLCVILPDGLRANTASILKNLQAGLGETVSIVGGVAAEQPKAEQTYQFYRGEVLQDAMPLLLFGGELHVSHGFASGWKPIGKQGKVTRVEGNILHTIDDRPALEFYQHYFDHYSPDAAYPLAVFAPGETKFFLRGSLSYDADVGSLTMGGDIPLGSLVQITQSERDDIVHAAKASLQQAWDQYPGVEPEVALYFSCAWRRWVLGMQTEREYEAIATRDEFKQLPACGFYTFGEIAPLQQQGAAALHNTTFVSLLMGTR